MDEKILIKRIDELTAEKNALEKELFLAKEQIADLRDKLDALEQKPGSKGGRHYQDEKWTEKWCEWRKLYEKGLSQEYICQQMGIGRATYFRYKKEYVNSVQKSAE